MSTHETLSRARDVFARHAWREARDLLAAAERLAPLPCADLERLATSAYLLGDDEASLEAWTRAHHEYLRVDDAPHAVRCAFWLILQLLASGGWARAGGWLGVAQRLVDDRGDDCAERGLLLVLTSRVQLKERSYPAAYETSCRAVELGERYGDPELIVFGRFAQALALTRLGEPDAAVRLFDEVMVGVTTRQVSPIAVGTVYCGVIDACYELLDVARAREWTEALARWCGAQPDLVPFRGHCLVRRAETMRLCGAWPRAAEEAEQACRGNPRDASTPIGAAFYELAEIHRMRGRLADAEDAYRSASEHGRSPEPGLALLRLAQGRVDVAATAIRRVLGLSQSRCIRSAVLSACVEITIAARDLASARCAADELARMAAAIPAPFLRAAHGQAQGAIALAEHQSRAALDALRAAWLEWQAIDVPYEAARVRVLLGQACRQMSDDDAAEMEFAAARNVFERLGAAPEIARLDGLIASARQGRAGPRSPLTPRERQVIRLLAAGRTNRAIADALAISERTVDRHVSNILTKLDLPSRSAATAYAYEHGLV
jgi:DNA-binding CsgD family transcriptional regulator